MGRSNWKMEIKREELQELCRHAADEYPRECCGILLGDQRLGRVQKIYRAGNVAAMEQQGLHFQIDPLEIYRVENEAERDGVEVVGFYHSHADFPAVLSEEDRSFMIPGQWYIVISVMDGAVTEMKGYVKRNVQGEILEENLITQER